MTHLTRGTRLGQFTIRDCIGEGGMGTVYKALDTALGGRTVAIKTLKTDKIAEPEWPDWLARFRREAQAIAKMDHPNIVKIHQLVEVPDQPPYLVMEYLPGQNLQGILRQQEIGISYAVDILLDTCHAIWTCHRYGYIHRDLKATNVFLADFDGVEMTKVLDFGLAKTWRTPRPDQTDSSELTGHGKLMGTPLYLAPEILNGARATPASDQYSLGVLLYIALTRRKPFQSSNTPALEDFHLWQKILKGEHQNACTHRPEIAEGLDQVIETAMHKDATQRFASLHAMGGALLPWASPRGRERWSEHFTSAPRAIRQEELSVENPDGTFTGTQPSQDKPAVPALLSKVATPERLSISAGLATSSRPSDEGVPVLRPAPQPPSLSVNATFLAPPPEHLLQEAGRRVSGMTTGPTAALPGHSSEKMSTSESRPAQAPKSSLLHRPRLLVFGLGTIATFILSFAVVRSTRRSDSARLAPPPALFDSLPARPAPSPKRVPQPPTSPPALSPTRVVATPVSDDYKAFLAAPPAPASIPIPPRLPKSSKKARHNKPAAAPNSPSVDQNGIVIPTE